MKFLFLIGAEGSGHHLFRSLLAPHFAEPWFVFEGAWHSILIEQWDDALRWESQSVSNSEKNSSYTEMQKILEQLERSGVTHAYENASFPFNNPRNSLRRPDLIAFNQIIHQFAECRYLILYRDPVSMTYSAIRRKFTDNPYLQSKIVEDNLIYIATQMQQMDVSLFKTIRFEELISQPDAHIEKLEDWWSLDRNLLEEGTKNIRSPTELAKIPGDIYSVLSGFFTKERTRIWEQFYSSNKLLSL